MKLQFKQQQYQLDAVSAVVDCFAGQPLHTRHFTLQRSADILRQARLQAQGRPELEFDAETAIGYRNSRLQLSPAQLLANIQQVQRRNGLFESAALATQKNNQAACHLTIEMETGTGKTYTYIRTMYELHRQYGFSKFIIIVPGIAIREGVYKSFELTQDHFQELYGHRIAAYIYNSARPQDIEHFASGSRISVLIINTQAFAASGADARRITQELDQFGSRRPIDIIAQTNPILIIDEPQSVDGDKTLQRMQDFKPLFTLRYSATHKVDYNKVYRLDALDAYQQKLVKKIQVKGISLKGSTGTSGYLYLQYIELAAGKAPLAVVEYEKRGPDGVKRVRQKLAQGASLYELSGNLPAYKNQVITGVNGYLNKIVVGGDELRPGELLNNTDELVFRRLQIRETILSHLQKEKALFDKGIKVLSLFFIDAVEKYREYDAAGQPQPGDYARLFEEEYQELRQQFMDMHQPGYLHYLQRDAANRVHQGYFAVDKKGHAINPAVKRGQEESDDASAYDLIMKDKERLLSFDEPTRFIFSHSALKEGWDNPNVFQICALKNAEGGSQTRRRQEVGRGMRLCVNATGHRLDFDAVGEQVHDINKLTVVASESYEAFAKGLQQEMAATLSSRPQKAEAAFFTGRLLCNEAGQDYRLTEGDGAKLNKILYKHDLIDDNDQLTDAGREQAAAQTLPLPEHLQPWRQPLCRLLQGLYSGTLPPPENERDKQPLQPNHNFAKKAFLQLWDRISLKTIYEVKFDTEKLVQESIVLLNAQLQVAQRQYEVKTGELQSGSRETLQQGGLMVEQERHHLRLHIDVETDAVYDLVGEIETRTHLTRRTIAAILSGIKPEVFLLLRKNPEGFIARASQLMNEAKARLIINNIVYHKTDARYDARTVFTNDKQVLRGDAVLKKHIYDCLSTDSQTEAAFAQALEASTEVVVYAKLPSSFYIRTPVGKYTPDWAIVLDRQGEKHIYFVAETKGSDNNLELREVEHLKLHCAGVHFHTISGGAVQFAKVSGYEKLMEVVGG
jgi:type III restriction enzyme